MHKLSKNQKRVIVFVADCCKPSRPTHHDDEMIVPAYIPHTDVMFDSLSEQKRFFKNLEDRGFIRIDRLFAYITEKGKKEAEKIKEESNHEHI